MVQVRSHTLIIIIIMAFIILPIQKASSYAISRFSPTNHPLHRHLSSLSAISTPTPTPKSTPRPLLPLIPNTPPPPTHAHIILTPQRSKVFLNPQTSSPLIYSKSLAPQTNSIQLKTGQFLPVYSSTLDLLGYGFYNNKSMYSIRVMVRNGESSPFSQHTSLFPPSKDSVVRPSQLIKELLKHRVKQAFDLRKTINLPSSQTTVYRLINGEGDRLSGLNVDVFNSIRNKDEDGAVVMNSGSVWTEIYRDDIINAIASVLENGSSGRRKYIWRRGSGLTQDGWTGNVNDIVFQSDGKGGVDLSRGVNEDELDYDDGEDKEDGEQTKPKQNNTSSLTVVENSILYKSSPTTGQKTGFYCDQRENRLYLRSLINPTSKVLDLFCYSGGFTFNALTAGAAKVVSVDSSNNALDLFKQNLEINGFAEDGRCQVVNEDCYKYMNHLYDKKNSFDIVICDPPKLAPTRNSLEKGRKKYRSLNIQAFRLVKPGGLLMTFSCSGVMSQDNNFESMVMDAARVCNRDVVIVKRLGAGMDHGCAGSYIEEGKYLEGLVLCCL